MELEFDKFYEDRRHEREVSSPLNLKTILTAFGLHLAAFVLFWVAAKIIYRTPDVIIPIDMTIVPPWAEQDPNDPEPDPNPPPQEQPKPERTEVRRPDPEPPKAEEKVEAVEKIPEKPKKKEFKKSEIKHPEKEKKKVEKPKKKEFKRGAIKKPPKILPPMKLPPGKGTSRDKPLSQAEIMKALAAGAKFGASNQLAANEEQRCISLISRRFYECWTDFNWSENLRPVLLSVRFGAAGKILGYRIVQSSGDAKVDQSVLAAAKRADHVSGLSAEFLKQYPEITISMTPKRQ